MNRKNLAMVLGKYVDKFDVFNGTPHIEWYKWTAINHFQEHWNLDAVNFAEMFNEAVAEIKHTNLIDSTTAPLKGLLEILKIDKNVEIVRTAFRELFVDDAGDLDNRLYRIDKFIMKINALILEQFPSSWKYPQDRKSVIWYLNLWNPKDNYIFKAVEAKNIVDCIEYADDFGSGMNFSLEKYYRMCNALREEIINFNGVLEKHNNDENRKTKGYTDDYHILVFDVIYCADTYNLYDGIDIFKGSAKERMKNAEIREIREALDEKEELLQFLEENKPLFPNFTGNIIQHKKFGECIVRACSENELKIEVGDVTKTLANTAVLVKNGIIVINNDEVNEALKVINEWEERKRITKIEKANLKVALGKLGK